MAGFLKRLTKILNYNLLMIHLNGIFLHANENITWKNGRGRQIIIKCPSLLQRGYISYGDFD